MNMRRAALVVLGFALGGFCLWLSTRTVDWPEAVRIFRDADPADIGIGIALFGTGILLRTVRLRTILAFRARISFGRTLQALLAGYAVNSILPARLGEFFRAHYLGRLTGMSRSGVLASIVVERLLDLVTVICALAAGLAATSANAADKVTRVARGECITFDRLSGALVPAQRSRRSRIRRTAACSIVVTFGKHKGRTLRQVARVDPRYPQWMASPEFTNEPFREAAAQVLRWREARDAE